MSRKSKPKVVHADELKMGPVDPDSEDKPRNWLTESEVIGEGPMNSGDEEGPQGVDKRQEEGRSLADLEVSDMETEGGTHVDTSRKIPVYPVWRFQPEIP